MPTRSRWSPWTTLFLALAASLACTATPSKPIAPGSRVIAALYDGRSGSLIALANASHPVLGDVYSHEQRSAALKLAPDELIGELRASFDEAGFGRWAQPAPAGRPRDPLRPGAFGLDPGQGFLALVEDDLVRVFVEPARGSPASQRQDYANLKLVMDLYYTPVGGLQYIENDRGAQVFDQDFER